MAVKLRKKAAAKNRISLYLDIYSNGKRQYEFLKLYLDKSPNASPIIREKNREILALAEKIRADRETAMDYSRFGKQAPLKQQADFVEFCQKQIIASKSPNSQRNYNSCIRHLKDYFKSDTIPISLITTTEAEKFKDYLQQDTGLSRGTVYCYFTEFKTLMSEAKRKGLFTINPVAEVRNVKSVSSKKEYLTIDEVRKLATTDYRKPDVARAFLFSCFTGLRHVDVSRLKYRNIAGNTLTIDQQKTDERLHIPLNETALKLTGTGNPDETIFKIPDVSRCDVFLKEWAKAAEIEKKVTFHVSRNTFATSLLTSGADISTVSKLLGHKSLRYVLIYAKITNELKTKAVNNLPGL
jgi:site-specific recombinase XerD